MREPQKVEYKEYTENLSWISWVWEYVSNTVLQNYLGKERVGGQRPKTDNKDKQHKLLSFYLLGLISKAYYFMTTPLPVNTSLKSSALLPLSSTKKKPDINHNCFRYVKCSSDHRKCWLTSHLNNNQNNTVIEIIQ